MNTAVTCATSTNATNSSGKSITLNEITKEAGTYQVTYTIAFTYNGANITKTKTQTVIVS